MAVQYWVGDFFIDLSRNQITQNQQSQTLAPRALAVLTYLAENQGRVVSHDELLDKIWQDTVVSPNTLHRSIAQLRKALGDDGKDQAYIRTHAKQGYSLECDVRWHDDIDSPSPNNTQQNAVDEHQITEAHVADIKPGSSRPAIRLFSIAAGIIILAIIGSQLPAHRQTSQLTFDQLRSLTATDDKEFYATYTPDGQYIVFHRYLDNHCGNKLWAKNISTQEEIQLTKDWGDYGSHSFSKDGRKLVFIETYACSEPVVQKDCYDLVSLDFEKALESPQQPGLILRCRNSDIKRPIWISNENIAILQRTSDRWKLIDYSISKNESTDLYDIKDGNIIDFNYSGKDDQIAVTSIHNDGRHYIDMLKPDGRIISSYPIERPQEIPKYRPIYPGFDPVNKQLIFSTGKQLFTLSYDGKATKINLPFDERMTPTEFHPDGKRLLLIKGRYDSDIALLQLSQIAVTNSLTEVEQGHTMQPRYFPGFERSNLGEDSAIFQPNGNLIAFWSERSGEEQLWISDGNRPQQLTQFPVDNYLRGIDWAADGESLLVNANGLLTQVYLDSSQQSFPLEHPVVRLFQWDSENNTALLSVLIKGTLKLVEVDLNNSTISELTDKRVIWALRSEDGRLIYKDLMGRFWQPGPAEDQHIKTLDKQGDGRKSFLINGNEILAINSENRVWSYNLDDDAFNILGEVSKDVDSLTDINQSQILMTVRVFERKEVVELSLSEKAI